MVARTPNKSYMRRQEHPWASRARTMSGSSGAHVPPAIASGVESSRVMRQAGLPRLRRPPNLAL